MIFHPIPVLEARQETVGRNGVVSFGLRVKMELLYRRPSTPKDSVTWQEGKCVGCPDIADLK